MTRRWVDLTERALYLRGIPVTAKLPQAVVHAVASRLVARELEPGARLAVSGQLVGAVSLLIEGRVGLFLDGKRVGELQPPQSSGFINCVARKASSFDVIAETPLRTLELSQKALFALLEDHYPLLISTLRYTAERLLGQMREMPESALGLPSEKLPLVVPQRSLNLVEVIYCLRALSAFRTMNLNTLFAMAGEMREQRFVLGEELFLANQPAEHTYFVLDGWVRCTTPDGRRFRYGPGTAVGGSRRLPRRFAGILRTPTDR
jgi:CRP-like cAMP-binding protein